MIRENLSRRYERVVGNINNVREIIRLAFEPLKRLSTGVYQMEGSFHSYREKYIPESYFLKVISEALKNVDSDSTILDIGSGKGEVSSFLEKNGFSSVTNLDFSIEGLIEARNINPESKVVQSTAETLPFKNNSFEVIHLKDILPHIKDESAFFIEISRVLTDGGKVIISTVSADGIIPGYYVVVPYMIPIVLKKLGFSNIKRKKWKPNKSEIEQDWYGKQILTGSKVRHVFIANFDKGK